MKGVFLSVVRALGRSKWFHGSIISFFFNYYYFELMFFLWEFEAGTSQSILTFAPVKNLPLKF